jgi:hypothetical protein
MGLFSSGCTTEVMFSGAAVEDGWDKKPLSLYTRGRRVKVLDVFRGNLRGIIFGRNKSARIWN